MDASQLFSRCMRQLLLQQPGCLRLSRNSISVQKRGYLCHTRYTSIRLFTSGVRKCQSNVVNTRSKSEDRDSGADNRKESGAKLNNGSAERKDSRPSAAQNAALRWSKASQDASNQLDALLRRQSQRNGGPGTNSQSETSPSTRTANSLPDVSAMLDELTWGRTGGPAKEQAIALRMRPTLGRQVEIESHRGIDVTRAFQMLENKCNKGGNSVKADERNQKTHVRRGQKRKILRRMRWRTLFQQGFLEECARVRKMIKQGW